MTRILDLGDLTWNREKALVCPVNKLGHVDLLLVPQSDRPDQYIANLDTRPDRAFDLDVLVYANGRMQVTNTRSGYTESYPAR
jgi:hypothetical protein